MVHQKPAYTIKEVEDLLSLSHAKLYQEISSRRILTYKVGKRRFVSSGALDQYIVDREAEGQANKTALQGSGRWNIQ